MRIRLIRSATLRLKYSDRWILVDPYLAPKNSRPSFAGKSPNPLVDLPCAPLDVIAGIEWVFVSHLHSDHFDPAAQDLLPKSIPVLCQPCDAATIEEKGFQHVIPFVESIAWPGLTIMPTTCQHGSGEVLTEMGRASGFVMMGTHEPTVYWAGDTVWNENVESIIARYRPGVIVTHSCGAVWGDGVLIVMDAEETVEVCRAARDSKVIATHMDALDHAMISRQDLRRYADTHGIGADQLLIPQDGEELIL